MPKIADTAQIVMDLYLQDYRTDEDFFTLFHFKYLCGVALSKKLEDEYKQNRRDNLQEMGFSEITLSPEWTIPEKVTFTEVEGEENYFEAKLKHPVFSFPWDAVSNGIRNIVNISKGPGVCKSFIREDARRKWALEDQPVSSDIYWFFEDGKVICYSKKCKISDANIFYVTDPSDESFGEDGGEVTKAQEDYMIKATLDILKKAKLGAVVDMTNNGNPNSRAQTEIDTVFTDDLRTKPIQ